LATDEPHNDDQSSEAESVESGDDFDQSLDVDAVAPPGDRQQNLDRPNLTDPASRAQAGTVPAPQAIQDAENEDRRKIRKKIVYPVLVVAGVQFVVADVVFAIYGSRNHWHIPSTVMTAWLSSTVVQIVGIVLIVMNYLFPKGR
jgi:hypothetical protein